LGRFLIFGGFMVDFGFCALMSPTLWSASELPLLQIIVLGVHD